MALRSTCPHILHIQQFYEDSLKERAQGSCDSCLAKGPNFWLCLERKCGYVGCGESAMDHSSKHTEKYNHFVALNLKSRRAWCADCDCEVFPNAIVHKEIEALVKTKTVREEVHETIMQQDIIRNPRCSPLYRDSFVSEALAEYLQDETRVRGLTGLRNLGNTCYLNSGIQALSNCPPFTQFFLECDNFITTKKKPYIAQIYKRLMLDIWGRKRHGYMNPNSLVSSFKQACPMFKGYTQQDAQEFLRCFMDRLHEELKEPITSEDDSEEEDERSPHAESPSVERKRSTRSSTEAAYSDSELSNLSDGEGHRTRARSRRHENRHRTISASHVELRTDGSDDGADQDGTPEADQAIVEAETGQGDSPSQLHRTHSHENVTPRLKDNRGKKRKAVKYQSIVSDVFDGKILSSVQCLTCLRESKCKETFQDLSLPIPGKEDLIRIQGMGSNKPNTASCSTSSDGSGWWGWFTSWFSGVSSWLYGPSITLDSCLAAFFSQDDLKGDNMYSCEKCGKLRNGVKISKVQELPEVLCIHLKRFRHDSFSSYSSKISNYVEFPIDNLDMSGYVSEDCSDECKIYDLTAVICHHGTAGGGHYTAYAQNWLNSRWFEFDDTYVTEVEEIAVMNTEAYVLFYRKKSEKAEELRQTVSQLCQQQEQSLIQFYISLKWLNKFNTFVEPGPITNSDFLCKHGAVPPHKAAVVDKLFVKVPQSVWEALHNRFGGGPVVNHLSLQPCLTCQAEIDQLTRRREEELSNFIKLHEAFTNHLSWTGDIYYISLAWFNQWEAFVKAKEQDPPGPIDNKPIAIIKDGYVFNRPGGGSAQISEETWKFLHSIYDGGPEIVHRVSRTAVADTPANDPEEEDVDEDDEGTE